MRKLALALVVASVAAALLPEALARPDQLVYLEASGRFLLGAPVGVTKLDDDAPVPDQGLPPPNLWRGDVVVDACFRDVDLLFDYSPQNVSASTEEAHVAVPFLFKVGVLGEPGHRNVTSPGAVPLGLRQPGPLRVQVWMWIGAAVTWDATVRGLAAGDLACEDRVRVAEVEANPSGIDDGNEWLELWNEGLYDVDVSGWTLTATHGEPAHLALPAGTVLAPDARLVVTFPQQALDDEDEVVVLTDLSGAERDRTPALSDGADDERSNQLGADEGWTFAGATPGS